MLVHYDISLTLINFAIKKIIKNNKEINQKIIEKIKIFTFYFWNNINIPVIKSHKPINNPKYSGLAT